MSLEIWNTHFPRHTTHVRLVSEFVEQLGITVFWSHPDNDPNHLIQNVDYTHSSVRNNVITSSTVDHFIGSNMVYECVKEAGVIHSADNFSDHSPIYAKLNIGELDRTLEAQTYRSFPSWKKATNDDKVNFSNDLAIRLNNVHLPGGVDCLNVKCKCDDHNNEIDQYCCDVLEAVNIAATDNIPLSGGKKEKNPQNKNLAGWSEFVKPYQDEAKFWHAVWVSAEKPRQGELFNVMRQTKSQYA